MQEIKSFDKELFLEICKKYNIPFSKEYETPMIKLENEDVIPLSKSGLKKDYYEKVTEFLYNNKKHYSFLFDTDRTCIYEE
jgi:hypothetical protein